MRTPLGEPTVGNEVRSGLERVTRAIRIAEAGALAALHRRLTHPGSWKRCAGHEIGPAALASLGGTEARIAAAGPVRQGNVPPSLRCHVANIAREAACRKPTICGQS